MSCKDQNEEHSRTNEVHNDLQQETGPLIQSSFSIETLYSCNSIQRNFPFCMQFDTNKEPPINLVKWLCPWKKWHSFHRKKKSPICRIVWFYSLSKGNNISKHTDRVHTSSWKLETYFKQWKFLRLENANKKPLDSNSKFISGKTYP